MPEPSSLEVEREALVLFEQLLDIEDTERAAWIEAQTLDRPRLRDRLLALAQADSLISLKTGAAVESVEPEDEPDHIGAYRLTGLIGRGGMGSVYRGERMTGDFTHVVAVKIVKRGLLSQSLVGRFERERQMLAQLAHPHIAQLYDGGAMPDGSPFIVMEYVDGVPLLQWVAEHAAPLDRRLGVFEDMCRAVAFAHGHLIVHRDLTPSNILVTRDGVVKLIDFGIARPADELGSGGHSRATASLSLTPGYAAPERLTSTEVTTAADIYSLGRLLDKLIEDAEDKQPELEAIVTRATAHAAAERYPTVDALRSDVAAWRAGRPVSAFGGGRAYVFAKFVRRNRYAVGAACAAGVAVIVAFGLVLMANHRAELARAEAERRFTETRAIATTLLFDVYDEVSKVQGATKAREILARTGVDYLEKLADDRKAPVDVRIEAGKGFIRLSQVVGGGQEGTLGRYKDATALLNRGEAVLKAVHDENPGNADAAAAYAGLLVEQSGNNLYNDSDPAKARAQAIAAEAILKDRAATHPKLANTYIQAIQAEGDSWAWDDDYVKARDVLQRADAFYKSLRPELQSDLTVLGGRSSSLRLLGEAYHKTKNVELARSTLAQNVVVNRERVRRDPNNPKALRGLILGLRYSGIVHRTNMRDAEARAAISESYSLASQWHQRDPADVGALELVSATGDVYAQVLTDLKQYDAAEKVSDEVIAVQRRRVELAGDAPFALRSLAATLMTRGGNFYNAGRYDKACEAWVQTRDSYALLDKRGQLTKSDRDNGYAEVKDFLARACHPPHDGLGDDV